MFYSFVCASIHMSSNPTKISFQVSVFFRLTDAHNQWSVAVFSFMQLLVFSFYHQWWKKDISVSLLFAFLQTFCFVIFRNQLNFNSTLTKCKFRCIQNFCIVAESEHRIKGYAKFQACLILTQWKAWITAANFNFNFHFISVKKLSYHRVAHKIAIIIVNLGGPVEKEIKMKRNEKKGRNDI